MSRKLTKDLIRSRLGIDSFESLKELNLWGNNIDDISLLSEMPLLEIISLSMNHIKDLSVFRNLKNLKELYLKDNQISDFSQIEYLKDCKKLEILCLIDNPISKQSNYRKKVLEILPFLKKLDDLDIEVSVFKEVLSVSIVSSLESSNPITAQFSICVQLTILFSLIRLTIALSRIMGMTNIEMGLTKIAIEGLPRISGTCHVKP